MKKTEIVNALCKFMVSEKKTDKQTFIEWQIAFNTNGDTSRGIDNKVWSQTELKDLYDRTGQHHGYSKCCHTICHNGNDFKYIVIKRHREDDPWDNHLVHGKNQLHEEISFWNQYKGTKYEDLVSPILKSFETKSDHNAPTTAKARDNIIIIAQKAEDIGDAWAMCERAEELNEQYGYHGESADKRYKKLESFADLNSWWDALENDGNSGVIFDYLNNCYKAVFVDYAL